MEHRHNCNTPGLPTPWVSPHPCVEAQPSTLQGTQKCGSAHTWRSVSTGALHAPVCVHTHLQPTHACTNAGARRSVHTRIHTHVCAHTGSPAGSAALGQPRLRAQPFHVPTQPLTPTNTQVHKSRSLLDSSGRKSTSLHPAPGPSHPGHGARPHCLPRLWWVWCEPGFPVMPAQRWFSSPSALPRDADAMAMHKPKARTAWQMPCGRIMLPSSFPTCDAHLCAALAEGEHPRALHRCSIWHCGHSALSRSDSDLRQI